MPSLQLEMLQLEISSSSSSVPLLCVPSQKGLFLDCPHPHSTCIFLRESDARGRPYLSVMLTDPSMMMGPLGLQQILTGHTSQAVGMDGFLRPTLFFFHF